MKRLTLVSPKKDTGRIMKKLMWLGAVELQKPNSDVGELGQDSFYSVERTNAERDIKVLESAINVLHKDGSIKRGIFTPLPEISQIDFDKGRIGESSCSEILEIAQEINYTRSEREALIDEKNALIQAERALIPWLSYGLHLSERETEKTIISLGTLPAYLGDDDVTAISDESGAVLHTVSTDKTNRYIMAVYLKSEAEEAVKVLSKRGFAALELSDMKDVPAGELERVRARISELTEDISGLENRLTEYGKHYDSLTVALDITKTKANLSSEKEKLLCTEKTTVLFGWIPCEHVKALEKQLSNENVYYQLEDPEASDDVPVHLVNTKPAGYFESVVEMYSLPEYGKFDPTRIMMIFFFIIFGMMLADVVYGVMLSLGCLFICKKSNMSQGVKSMCAMFGVCGVSCIIWGVLFGSYLGDLPAQFMAMLGIDFKPWMALDIMENAIVFLVLSLAVGAVHMLTGMGIRFYILCKNGQVFSAIFDEGSWFVLFAGVGLYFLNPNVGLVIAGTGVVMLVLTQGRAEKNPIMKVVKGVGSLYNLVSYISDLLSYSRIMALGLSSAVVASVFNILATMAGFSVPGIIIFVLILIVGHLLNLAINLLGTFVHTSRLQYVEFFGKFYEDGGRPFRPVKPVLGEEIVVFGETSKESSSEAKSSK